ncbi:MAG: hypothetical protein IPM56_07475 [Ignavibacteriales bacterium]|nr:MAG: hypothetical protein IPM56_07475 [Ignavibacteriales bacterium]
MHENFTATEKLFRDLVELHIVEPHKTTLEQLKKYIAGFSVEMGSLLKKYSEVTTPEASVDLNKIVTAHEKIGNLISSIPQDEKAISIEQWYPVFFREVSEIISASQLIVSDYQDEDRFKLLDGEGFLLKIRKRLKNVLYKISNLDRKIFNLLLKLFRKPLKPDRPWQHIILFRNLRKYFLYCEYSFSLIELKRNYFKLRSSLVKQMWQVYEGNEKVFFNETSTHLNENVEQQKKNLFVLNDSLQTQIKEYESSLSEFIDSSIKKLFEEYKLRYLQSGTIEFPSRRISDKSISKKTKQLSRSFARVNDGWANNFTALLDDWQLNNEIYVIRYKIVLQQQKLKAAITSRFESTILPVFETLITNILDLKKSAESFNTVNDFQKNFPELKNKIKSEFAGKNVVHTIEKLYESDLTGIVSGFDGFIADSVDSIGDTRILVRTDDYTDEIKDSEMNKFSPKEILEYTAEPQYFTSSAKLKTEISTSIEKVQLELSEIDHIPDFALDSALIKLQSENDIEQALSTASEGFSRTIKKIQEIKERLKTQNISVLGNLDKSVNSFLAELLNLTVTEKIFNIRITLAKAKAIQKSTALKEKVVHSVNEAFPKVLNAVKNSFNFLSTHYKRIINVFGLAPSAKVIATEVSDYLAETQLAINRLPFVYQKLFENRALEDERFFIGREHEISRLNKAYKYWAEGKFAPSIIIGEKGCGATSLINIFMKDISPEVNIYRFSITEPVRDLKDMLRYFSKVLDNASFESADDLITYLNSTSKKNILIVENLQKLFLRKVNGFRVLKIFFEIISKTNKNTFWISTCTLYGWIYIDKTIHAPDYFGHVIHLDKLNEEQIINLVTKRHRVSGYDIEYEADENILKSKSFRKLTDNEKQPYLLNKYFSGLNKFAQSNTSLALIYWLRSARNADSDLIKIGPPPELDYSFLNTLSTDKVFALYAMLIHDGLKIEDHSVIFDMPVASSNLLFILMHDDGIIVKHNELYTINPLLYRHVVGLLKSKNIIH